MGARLTPVWVTVHSHGGGHCRPNGCPGGVPQLLGVSSWCCSLWWLVQNPYKEMAAVRRPSLVVRDPRIYLVGPGTAGDIFPPALSWVRVAAAALEP